MTNNRLTKGSKGRQKTGYLFDDYFMVYYCRSTGANKFGNCMAASLDYSTNIDFTFFHI